MTEDAMARLKAADPARGELSVPSVDRVRAVIAAAPDLGRRRRRWPAGLLPGAGVAVALAVAAVAVITVGHGVRHRLPTTGRPQVNRPSPVPGVAPRPPHVTVPAGGMAGVVQLWGSTLAPSGMGVLSFEQCNPCEAPSVQRFAEWSLVTPDAGAHWSLHRQPFYLFDPQFDRGHDVWADGQIRGSVVNGIWASHDAGTTWHRVATPVATNEPGSSSVAAGIVWLTAPDCAASCRMTVLRGPGHAGVLAATAGQPAPHASDARIVAAADTTAYLEVYVGRLVRRYATHDGGRTWSRTGSACGTGSVDDALSADGPDSLWEQCLVGRRRFVVAHSIDGGRSWVSHPLPRGIAGLFELRPVGGGIVWAISDQGVVLRTADGGVSWHIVLDAGRNAVLMTGDATTALAVRTIGRGHVEHHAANTNLVAYRTSDGGAHWSATAIALPPR